MSKWGKVRLVDVCDFQGGSQPPKDQWINEAKDGYIRMLQIREFTQNRDGKEEYIKITKNVKTCDDTDILIARYGASVGKILTGLSGAYNVAIMKTIPDTKKLNKKYLRMFLLSNIFQNYIANVGSRAAQAGFNKTDLENISIPLPPLQTQKQIAKTLDTAAELLGMRKKQLAELDNLIKSAFYDMFGDPVTNEKGWEVRRLDDICSFEGGSQPPKAVFKSEYQEGYIRLIQIRDYKSDRFMTFIPEKLAKRFCDVDDIMIGRYGPPIFQILKGLRGAYNVALMKAVPKGINREFLRFYLGRTQLLIYLEGLSRRTAGQDGIQMDKLKEYPIILPPLALQTRFTSIVTKIEEQKTLVKKAIDETQYLFNSLMSEYFE